MSILPFPNKPPHPNGQKSAPTQLAQTFQICAAEENDIKGILALMEKVRQNLIEAGNGHHLKAKTQKEITALVQNHFPTLVAKDKTGNIIGFVCVTEQSVTQGAANLDDNYNQGHYLTINSVTADPTCRDQGIKGVGTALVNAAFDEALKYAAEKKEEGRDYDSVLAKVSTTNNDSQRLFLNADFNYAALGKVYTDSSNPENIYDYNVFMKDLPITATVGLQGTREEAWAARRSASVLQHQAHH